MFSNRSISLHGMGAHRKAFAFTVSLLAVSLAMTGEAFAAASGLQAAISEVLSQGMGIVQPLGIIAIIALGIGAMNGRITWTQALVVAIGISIASDPAGIASIIR